MSKPAKKVDQGPGVVFPPGPKGDRSTTEACRELYSHAVASQDAALSKEVTEKWGRYRYSKYVALNVEKSLASRGAALEIAEAGLSWAHNNFEFIDPETKKVFYRGAGLNLTTQDDPTPTPLLQTMKLSQAMKDKTQPFQTGVIKGKAAKPQGEFELVVPYKGKDLKGDELLIQIEKWVKKDVIEPSCGAAMAQVVKTKKWLDLSDQYVVLLGAGSAMGPLLVLLALGANVIAIDICPKAFRPAGAPIDPKRRGPWAGPLPGGRDGLIEACEKTCGTLTLPLPRPQAQMSLEEIYDEAGCNLLTQPAAIANWLMTLYPGKQLTIGAYAYLDGDRFVKISMAMDAVIIKMTQERKPPSALAYLCTPTDVHAVPAAAKDAGRANLGKSPVWQHLLRFVPGPLQVATNKYVKVTDDEGNDFFYENAIVTNQGPNYITAKRIQHWRAMVSREKFGCIVSSNIAPSTSTASVVSNRSFAWAYEGMHHFKPMEVFSQETSNAVMGALLINDLKNPLSAAHPDTKLRNPLELFSENSFHGGVWRLGFKFDTVGFASAIAYFVGGVAVNLYLTAYNAVQAVGWAVMAYIALMAYLAEPSFEGASGAASTWATVGPTLSFFQNLAALEVVHSLVGFVNTPWHSTFLQVISRLFVVGLYNWIPEISNSPAIYILAFAWGITEVIRYAWYAMNLQGIKIKSFTFIRYSTFLPLYPLGVFGELLSVYYALPVFEAENYSTDPAKVPYFIQYFLFPINNYILRLPLHTSLTWVLFPIYAVGLAFLYSYMVSQRNKAIGRLYPKSTPSKKDKKA